MQILEILYPTQGYGSDIVVRTEAVTHSNTPLLLPRCLYHENPGIRKEVARDI